MQKEILKWKTEHLFYKTILMNRQKFFSDANRIRDTCLKIGAVWLGWLDRLSKTFVLTSYRKKLLAFSPYITTHDERS